MADKTIRVHYDGWISLPSAVRQILAIGTGDEIAWTIVGDTVVLRSAHAVAADVPAREEAPAAPPPTAAPDEPAAAAAAEKPTRKTAAARKPKPSLALPRLPGRGRKPPTPG